MPKDFVGRLQDLENEMKTVLSICDETSPGIKANRRMPKGIPYPDLRSSSTLDSTNGGKVNDEENGGFTNVTAENIKPKKSLFQKKCTYEKPSSAPEPMPAVIKEGLQHLSKRKRFSGYSPPSSKKKETVESVESSEWFDCPTQNHEADDPLEQTLRPVEQILTDISHLGNADYFLKQSVIFCTTCRKRTFDCICRNRRSSHSQHRSCKNKDDDGDDDDDDDDENKESFIHHIKPGLQENPLINELVRKIEKKEMEAKSKNKPLMSLRSDTTFIKQTKNVQNNDKSSCAKFHGQDKRHGQRVRVSFDEDNNSTRPATAPATAPAKTRHLEKSQSSHSVVDRNEPRKRNRLIRNSTDRDLEKKSRINGNLNFILEEQQSESGNSAIIRQTVHCKTEGNVENISNEYSCSDAESSIDPKEDICHLKKKKNLSSATTRKIAEIIQKNHEKIEKMRKSKSLALDAFKDMKEKYDTMEYLKNELSEKFQELLGKNEELARELKETDASKQQIIQEWENYKKENSSTALLEKLQSVNEENLQFKEKIQTLEEQLQEKMQWTDENGNNNGLVQKISDMNQDIYYEYHILFKRQEAAYRRLVQGIAVLENAIKNNKEKEKRLSKIKAELKRRTAKTQSYLERLTSEKMELLHTVNKLKVFAEEQKTKMEELQEEINKRDEELEKHKKLLEEKSENLEETNKELESIRKTSMDLEDQVKTLRKSIESFDQMHQNLLKERQGFENTVHQVKEENNKLQEQILEEKESIHIKDKIIEDQQQTIKQLKEKSDEVKKMMDKVQSLERLINIERDEKLELQETIERLRRKKDELKQKVKSLESDLLLAPQEVVRDLQKTQIVLHELENQVQIKQKEWEMLFQSLIKEKEQACNVAAFATKKLIQTTSDFQRQSDSQKKLYKLLAENIVEKKKCLNESARKTVRFSEDLLQPNFKREQRTHPERQRLHHKEAGVLNKSKEWSPVYPVPLELFSKINYSKREGMEPADDFSENDEIYDRQI